MLLCVADAADAALTNQRPTKQPAGLMSRPEIPSPVSVNASSAATSLPVRKHEEAVGPVADCSVTAGSDHMTVGSDHVTADSDHVTAGSDHVTAGAQHVTSTTALLASPLSQSVSQSEPQPLQLARGHDGAQDVTSATVCQAPPLSQSVSRPDPQPLRPACGLNGTQAGSLEDPLHMPMLQPTHADSAAGTSAATAAAHDHGGGTASSTALLDAQVGVSDAARTAGTAGEADGTGNGSLSTRTAALQTVPQAELQQAESSAAGAPDSKAAAATDCPQDSKAAVIASQPKAATGSKHAGNPKKSSKSSGATKRKKPEPKPLPGSGITAFFKAAS